MTLKSDWGRAKEAGVPTLVEACEIIAEFHLIIGGVAKDEAAVRARSNGQTEGQITRL